MSRLRDLIAEEMARPVAAGTKQERAVAAGLRNDRISGLRAEAVAEQFRELAEHNMPVHHGGVMFHAVVLLDNGAGVDVRTDPVDGETHWRIFNPPTLVPDGTGDIEVRGRMHREDPLAALAKVIKRAGTRT